MNLEKPDSMKKWKEEQLEYFRAYSNLLSEDSKQYKMIQEKLSLLERM